MNKKIIFIPPGGYFKKQDFSILRIVKALSKFKSFSLSLFYIKSNISIYENFFDKCIETENELDLINTLKKYEYDYIFHRTWMHTYKFASILTDNFNNVLINIKDWNFAPIDEYNFLLNKNDYPAIKKIFESNCKVLSHFTNEQIHLWEKEYNINKDNFIFFPELCNEENFIKKNQISYKSPIKLVLAGNLHPTVYTQDYFPGKDLLNSIRNLTSSNINIDFITPKDIYNSAFNERKHLFYDLLYEDRFNKYFNIVKGEVLEPELIKSYHFGFFELESTSLNTHVIKYAIVSKFAFYLEAQIPMLVNKRFKSIASIVEKYSLGIVFENKDLNNLDKILDITQDKYNDFLLNIKKYRKHFKYTKELFEKLFS